METIENFIVGWGMILFFIMLLLGCTILVLGAIYMMVISIINIVTDIVDRCRRKHEPVPGERHKEDFGQLIKTLTEPFEDH